MGEGESCLFNSIIRKAVTVQLVLTLLLSFLLFFVPEAVAQNTRIRFIPDIIHVYDNGEEFTVACVVEDVLDLDGADIQIQWNTNYLDYVGHTASVPVEDFPSVPPSPYGGVTHAPLLVIKDEVEGTLGPGTYWLAFVTLGEPSFNGSGAAFNMTFRTKNMPFGNPEDYFDIHINITSSDLASGMTSIPHDRIDGVVRIHYIPSCWPGIPLMKVTPEFVECSAVGENITFDVYLMSKDMTTDEFVDLDPFWDVSGVDAFLNFDPAHLNFIDGKIDPDGWFAGFWGEGRHDVFAPTEDVPGQVHFAFVGIPSYPLPGHTPIFGVGRILTLTFTTLTDSTEFPPDSSPVYLENPQVFSTEYNFHSIGGLVGLDNPGDAVFHQLVPDYCEDPLEIPHWEDNDGDSLLSEGDNFVMIDLTSDFYFEYQMEEIACTLELTLAKSLDDHFWVTTFPQEGLTNNGLPGKPIGGGNPYNGFGNPDWYGNFSTTHPVSSVNSITVHALPFTQDEYTYTLTEGLDFIVHDSDNLIELLHSLDTPIINEHWVDGVNTSLLGWAAINYVASSIDSVWVDMKNGTARFGLNLGYAAPPPSEWWYDPDWPWELTLWQLLDYCYECPGDWPSGSEWWINYTATPYLTIDYNTDPQTIYIEYDGNYTDCLAITNANGTHWNEVYPTSSQSYDIVFHDDVDESNSITSGDYLWMSDLKQFLVEEVSTDIKALRKTWICEDNPVDLFFGFPTSIDLAGFPHPERDYCPWHNKDYSIPLPHYVEDAVYSECYNPTGGFIDIYTQYPGPFGGQGLHNPSDMFSPQKNVHLCANVTNGEWPEQNKDVTFEVIDPHGVTWGIWYGRTNAIGIACVDVRLPWLCNDPEYWFGEWTVIATVDVACIVINDTLTFKYDYRVHITDVELDKTEYKHCENMYITVYWLTRSMQEFNITFTVTAVDASGVPFGFDYITVTIGGAVYCSYTTGEVQLIVHVEKWARPPIGTLYVGALSDFPQNGGAPETPAHIINFTILPEWA